MAITGMQIRAARAALRWTSDDLARRAGVNISTVKRFEQVNDVPPSRTAVLEAVQRAFEVEGIEFTGDPVRGPGIRLWPERKLPL